MDLDLRGWREYDCRAISADLVKSLCSFAQDLGVALASRQRLEAGDHVEQLFIDGFLANTAEGAV